MDSLSHKPMTEKKKKKKNLMVVATSNPRIKRFIWCGFIFPFDHNSLDLNQVIPVYACKCLCKSANYELLCEVVLGQNMADLVALRGKHLLKDSSHIRKERSQENSIISFFFSPSILPFQCLIKSTVVTIARIFCDSVFNLFLTEMIATCDYC